MRRLPVFLLIDVSESMVGEPIRNVRKGLEMIINKLRSNPMALEIAYISLIVFAGKAKTLVPLTEIIKFNPPELSLGGGTALGHAMDFLMDEIDSQVIKTTKDKKGDWKSIVFLLTDGVPTDQCSPAINRWRTEFKKRVNLIAVSMGDQADLTILRELTEHILIFKYTDAKAYEEFFKLVSASIETKSMHVTLEGKDEFQLQDLDNSVVIKDDGKEQKNNNVDERFVILLSRCQSSKKPYLIKYEIESSDIYNYEGSYPISEEYFNLSSDDGHINAVSTAHLYGTPECPYCSNSMAGMCNCGKILCITEDEPRNKCPWCGVEGDYGVSEGGFDVTRTMG